MKLLLIISVILLKYLAFSQTVEPTYYYQRIKYIDFYRDGYNSYHLFTLSISNSQVTEDLSGSYKLVLLRNSKETNSVQIFKSSPENEKYRQFFPDLNSIHPKFKKYVIWDLDKSCLNDSLNSAGNLTYKLKYFDCDEELNSFYDSLLNTNKAKNLSSKFIEANVVLTNNAVFLNKLNLVKVLNGEENTLLNSVFCLR